MIVAIDGPAAAGKSTVARALAERLGLPFLDTGAMYRAVTLVVLERGLDPSDGPACERVAREIELGFDRRGRLVVDDRLGEPDIRSERVTREVSTVSSHPGVRRAIVPLQRAFAAQGGAVVEGRDTTSVVFPDADHKFFLMASHEERARRRAAELGKPESEGAIRADIEARDRADSSRADSPLVRVADAVAIETEGRTAEEVTELLLAHVLQSGREAQR